MLHSGHNEIDGVPVEVVRKRIRRINLRVAADGTVCLSVPKWWSTLRQGEEFLREKWKWVLKTRDEILVRSAEKHTPVTETELVALRELLEELNDKWSFELRQFNVRWDVRKVSSFWGSCKWGSRRITYNEELAHASRELVEYVVVHEYTHFDAHNHGPRFYALMNERLPGWQALRKRLNKREWATLAPAAPQPPNVAPEPREAPSPAARPTRAPAAPVPPPRANGGKATFVQPELW